MSICLKHMKSLPTKRFMCGCNLCYYASVIRSCRTLLTFTLESALYFVLVLLSVDAPLNIGHSRGVQAFPDTLKTIPNGFTHAATLLNLVLVWNQLSNKLCFLSRPRKPWNPLRSFFINLKWHFKMCFYVCTAINVKQFKQ